jgi:hypothetical protein
VPGGGATVGLGLVEMSGFLVVSVVISTFITGVVSDELHPRHRENTIDMMNNSDHAGKFLFVISYQPPVENVYVVLMYIYTLK